MGPLIFLFWTSGDICSGFQRQGGILALMLSCLASLVQHLLTSWWATWQQCLFDPHTCRSCVHKCKDLNPQPRVLQDSTLHHSTIPARLKWHLHFDLIHILKQLKAFSLPSWLISRQESNLHQQNFSENRPIHVVVCQYLCSV